ncbi:MAG: hypothetical protein WBD74_06310 [Candidatus Aquilonibacter sp.]
MAKTTRLNGTIVSATATSIDIRTSSGERTLSLAQSTRVLGLSNSSLDKVTQGSFIGTTVVPQPDNTCVSTEVHIFAPALRGTGEGFSKMDSGGTHMMANSTVRTVAQGSHMMANSTVRSVGSSAGRKMITMVFPSGTKSIVIPANTPVTYIEPGSKALLVPGAHVLVLAVQSPSGLAAKTLVVGEHGATPMQ